MANVTDPFREIFLAGIGALAIGAEKSQDLIDQLVQKGQLTVDQGKEIATNLEHDAANQTADMREQIIKAQMKVMTKEERDEFAARVAEMAAIIDGDEALMNDEQAEVEAANKE